MKSPAGERCAVVPEVASERRRANDGIHGCREIVIWKEDVTL